MATIICESFRSHFGSKSGMSIFRFSAEFRFFFFYFPLFWKWFSAFFEKLQTKKKIFFSFADTATIDYSKSFGKQSVTSWFAGMRFFRFRSMLASAVSPLGCRISTRHSRNLTLAAMLRVGVQHSRPLPFHLFHSLSLSVSLSVSLSLSLSLSRSHTHTHTQRVVSCYDFAFACCGQSLRAILAPKMLLSLTENRPDFLCSPRDFIAPIPPITP